MEQAIYTGCFFLTQAIVARSVPIDVFAEFSSFYSAVILLSIIHNCTVAEPILVFLGENKRPSAKSILIANIPGSIFAILFTIYISSKSPNIPGPVYALTLISFLTYWTNRSIAWQNGGIIKLAIPAILQTTCIYTLTLLKTPSLESILITISACLIIPSLTTRKNHSQIENINTIESAKFSSINLTAQTFLWMMTHGLVIYYSVTAAPIESTKLRVILTLILPAQYLNIALSNYYLPLLSKEKNPATAAIIFLKISAAAALAYGGVLYLFGNRLATLLYGAAFANIDVSAYFLLPFILSTIQSTRTILKARQKHVQILYSMSIGIAVFALTKTMKIQLEVSALVGLLASSSILSIQTIKSFKRKNEFL